MLHTICCTRGTLCLQNGETLLQWQARWLAQGLSALACWPVRDIHFLSHSKVLIHLHACVLGLLAQAACPMAVLSRAHRHLSAVGSLCKRLLLSEGRLIGCMHNLRPAQEALIYGEPVRVRKKDEVLSSQS